MPRMRIVVWARLLILCTVTTISLTPLLSVVASEPKAQIPVDRQPYSKSKIHSVRFSVEARSAARAAFQSFKNSTAHIVGQDDLLEARLRL